MSPKQPVLRGVAKKLVDQFDEAAKWWGWEQDQGHGSSVTAAESAHRDDKAALVRYIAGLQRRAAKVRKS